MVFLSQQALERLREYKYVSSPLTPFCRLMTWLLWEPVSKFLPRSLAPNAITIISSISIVSTTIILCLNSNLNLTAHPCVCYLALATAGYYFYNLLDVLDGKQARNLKVSSPLGQLLDHGLDGSVNTMCIAIINAIMLGVTDTTTAMILIIGIQSVFFFAAWNEYHIGVLRFQICGLGVHEFSHLNYIFLITTIIKGYEIWDITAFGSTTYRDLFIYYLLFL